MPTDSASEDVLSTARPWLAAYPPRIDPSPRLAHSSIVDAWRDRVAGNPGRTAVRYFDGSLSAAELDAHTDALAAELQDRDVRPGDRVGVYLQNVPYYPISLLAIWKAGGIAVPLNPMYRGRELRRLIDDSGTTGIILARGTDAQTRETLAGSTVRWLLSVSARDFQTADDPRVFGTGGDPAPSPDGDLAAILTRRRGQHPEPVETTLDDTAFLTYTSGTTGPPKGALNTHRNFLNSVLNYGRWLLLEPGDVVFAIAPLFHITGLSLNAGIALLNDTTLSMSGRFEPSVVLEAFRDHGVTTTIGSITAFNAFFRVDGAGPEHFATVQRLYSGGAPIPPSTVEAFRSRFGPYLHNIWGMTETTGGGIAVPPGAAAPVHGPSGTLSIGVPMQNVDVWITDENGAPRPPGVEGELVIAAPQVIPGYWRNPEASAHALAGGRLRTGDVAVLDAAGWVYLVDRVKDQINTSGFKVWPREVEDVLYEHPDVFEAAVVGLPDAYRGETVAAYVSLRDGAATTPEELTAFARERLAAYKYPRRISILPELPKTATGKIQRAVLREQAPTGQVTPAAPRAEPG
ncbi:AMP-binding protein [Frankia sp. Mgl5]|uniref:class I adenylate-forming enzyme family protein n=1 Tax=Frankia sp. Mgl5 TaxID=2933793 RepID=UPI00200F53C2|nr:AMP-binding protein [Frankia sp. Mgl5]MCK9929154.1 AMP-binding protein [Frankia sp. Mgl5]